MKTITSSNPASHPSPDTLNQQLQWAITFASVVEHGSFTKAADVLGCSKALASKQVLQLEALLGAQLLFRTTRRLHLTEAGRVYLAHCSQWPQWVSAARQAVMELREEVAGLVRLTVPTSFGGVFMAQALLAFRARYPQVEVELDLSSIQRDLEAEGWDLAIRSNAIVPDRLVSRPLSVMREWVVASPALFGDQPPPHMPAGLRDWPCLINSHFRNAAHWAFSQGAQLHAVDVHAALRVNDFNFLRNLALAGAGITRLPDYLAATDVSAGRLIRLLPDFELTGQPLYLVYPQRLPQPAKVRALIDFLLEWFMQPQQQALLGARESH
ncbi:LysR family transcriptional regulator [Andreprevotia chitinilytica]|uniref:LysR family transcriptional regulator n=1 Tax=Andreprevotia chitinilytica TaxID=396808 RepID=UPI00068E8044|nr:LysR family transcriptional regulator [Andreprevotia chitinilytica]